MTKPGGGSGDGGHRSGDKDSVMAKTAGFIVFSGIAISLLKALNPRNRARNETQPLDVSTQPIAVSTQPIWDAPAPPPPPPPLEPVYEKPITRTEQYVIETVHKTVVIAKGDTLWGLSRKYGVSVDAIKEANGLTGNTIYAGKKLVIP